MNRTGLLIALAIAAVTGLVFGFFPDLDLRIAGFSTARSTPRICLSRGVSTRR